MSVRGASGSGSTKSRAGAAPTQLAESRFSSAHGRVSPDGHWMVFSSDESGAFDIYVQDFPIASRKRRLSATGGSQPVWSRDGKEVFYLAADGRVFGVPMRLVPNADPAFGEPVPLFQTRVEGSGAFNPGFTHQFDVSPDGQRFLVNTLDREQTVVPPTVVINWTAALDNTAPRR